MLERLTHDVPVALDVGCGSGREAIALMTRGWKVVALDRDARALQRLEALAERQARAALQPPDGNGTSMHVSTHERQF